MTAMTEAASVRFERNSASVAFLLDHLQAADDGFSPRLSERVDLTAYAEKLIAHAERFEAWSGDRLVGLVAAYCNGKGVCHPPTASPAFVSSVSVLPEWRGVGIARELMHRCITLAAQRRLQELNLEVNECATAALSLYYSLGFLPTKATKPPSLVLTLDLRMVDLTLFD